MNFARIFCLTAVTVFLSIPATAGTFYQWTDADGVIHATDDPKKVPSVYQGDLELRNFQDIEERVTHMVIPSSEYANHVHTPTPVAVEDNPNREEVCDEGAVTVSFEWRKVGDRQRRIYIAKDECGRVISETFFHPTVQVNR